MNSFLKWFYKDILLRKNVLTVLLFTLKRTFSVTSCAFVSNLSESSAAPTLQPGHKSMQSVLDGDLVMNVFRDGHWGVFRHQLISHGTTQSILIMICFVSWKHMVAILE